jgi:tetratricopeptide (TPR) repeat protein
MQRRLEESVAALRQAHELDRLSLTIRIEYANALSSLEHHDEALRELERARELDPQRWRVYQSMAIVHAARGDWSGAIDALQQDPGYRSRPPNPWLGYYYAAAGRRVDALEILHRVEAQAEEGKSLGLGILHWGLGNKETALDLIEQGVRERRGDIMTTTALYRLLKGEPRYQAMLREMGLSLSDTHSAGTPKSAK